MGIVRVTEVSRQKSRSLPAKGKKYGFVGSLVAVSSLFGLALFQVGRFHPPSRRRAITKPNQALRRRSWQNGNGPRCFLARRPAQSVSGTPRHRVSGACIFERKRCIQQANERCHVGVVQGKLVDIQKLSDSAPEPRFFKPPEHQRNPARPPPPQPTQKPDAAQRTGHTSSQGKKQCPFFSCDCAAAMPRCAVVRWACHHVL